MNREIKKIYGELSMVDSGSGKYVYKGLLNYNTIRTQQEESLQSHSYWKDKADTFPISNEVLKLIMSFAPDIRSVVKNDHIGLLANNTSREFAIFTPKNEFFKLGVKQPKNKEFGFELDKLGIEHTYVNSRKLQYIYLSKNQIKQHADFLTETLKLAYMKFSK